MAIISTITTAWQCNICQMNYSSQVAVCINAADAMHQAVEPSVTYNPNTPVAPPDTAPPPD